MRKILAIIFILIVNVGFSQEKQQEEKERLTIEKGRWNFGGTISVGKQSYDTNFPHIEKSFNFQIIPKTGYAVSNNFIIGLALGFVYIEEDNSVIDNSINSSVSRNLSVIPYVRKHYGLGRNFSLFIEGNVSYGRGWLRNNRENNNTSSSSSFGIGVSPVINYFVSKHFALEAILGRLGYSKSKYRWDFANYRNLTTEFFGFNLDSSTIYFGLTYYL